MTVDLFLELLHAHLAALRSASWRDGDAQALGPALFLDAVDTQALIAELTQLRHDAQAVRSRLPVTPLRQRPRYRKLP